MHAGSQVTRLPLRAETGWQIDLDELAGAIRENTRLILINQPHNPSGTLMSAAKQRALVECAGRRAAKPCAAGRRKSWSRTTGAHAWL